MDASKSIPNNVNLDADVDSNDIEDKLDPMVVAQLEARDVIQSILDIHKPQVKGISILNNVVPFVEYDGHVIYKSTLVSQLNDNPFLSKD